jgi:hypothetical protein
MAKVPVPDRGQPLDVSYLYQLAEAINNLSDQLSPTITKYTTVDTVSSGKQNIRTSDSRIIGGFISVSNGSTTTAGNEVVFSYNLSGFAYAPIVTATPITTDTQNTQASKDVSLILTSVTSQRIDGVVRFNKIGVSSVGVNIIAVGIPV